MVQYTYDAANQLASVVQMNHPDSAHNTTAYGYDARGNRITTTEATPRRTRLTR